MATFKRSNPKAFDDIAKRLQDIDDTVGRVGFFESSVYENGMPVAAVAAVNELGANISHPGGTPYTVGAHGARFVTKDKGAGLPVTKAHTIIIPPRPFMRPTFAQKKDSWRNLMLSGMKSVMKGATTAMEMMDKVALRAAGDVSKTITNVWSPPLAKGTIAARKRKRANKKTTGNLTKPLIDEGIMLAAVTGKSEKVNGS